jgi:alpha-D-ribose 1-methylphosphonate 5-triphosphate synthase subunit PhnH
MSQPSDKSSSSTKSVVVSPTDPVTNAQKVFQVITEALATPTFLLTNPLPSTRTWKLPKLDSHAEQDLPKSI